MKIEKVVNRALQMLRLHGGCVTPLLRKTTVLFDTLDVWRVMCGV